MIRNINYITNQKIYAYMRIVKSMHLFCLSILIQIFLTLPAFSQIINKKINPWYIYKEGNSFADIEPLKDIISSISVFGTPNKEFISECHKNNIEVYHAVSGNEETINSASKIEMVVNEYINDCVSNGYDGIDLDFENLDPGFQNTYSEFLIKTSSELHKAGKKLSHCVGFYPTLYQDEVPKIFYNPKVIAETCDLVRVMCYDMYFAPGRSDKNDLNRDDCQGIGPTSNYSWTKEAMAFWLEYVSRNKLVMALPAYSNDYEISSSGRGKQVYFSVPDSIKGNLTGPIWLWYEKINMYLYNDLKGDRHIFYASDSKSTKALLEIAEKLNIGNIGFWHFNSVDPKIWEVVKQWIKN